MYYFKSLCLLDVTTSRLTFSCVTNIAMGIMELFIKIDR